MSQTNIEYFNSTLTLFVNNIIKFYPEYKDTLDEYYSDLLTSETSNDDKHIKRFMRKFSECKKKISTKDESLFDISICFIKNVDFKDIWTMEKTDTLIKDKVWDYLQTLFVIGETIITDSNKIKSLVENLKKKRDNEDDTDVSENKDLLNMIDNLSNKSKDVTEDMIENGLIGNLAKELANDINLDDMNLNLDESGDNNIGDIFGKLMGGDNPMKFMNLIQNVGKKIQSKLDDGGLDQSKLLDEAQNMMGLLGNNNPLFDNLINNAKKEIKQTGPPKTDSSNNPTRDRLRKKLADRKNASK
tara:strand:+ start:2811 stop:3713 length:903 start_codon:yes stop_codon:yes gene_type:complete